MERGVRGERRPWREASVERGVCFEAAPGGLKYKEAEGPSLSSAHYLYPSIGQSQRATATGPRNVLPWLITP